MVFNKCLIGGKKPVDQQTHEVGRTMIHATNDANTNPRSNQRRREFPKLRRLLQRRRLDTILMLIRMHDSD